MTSDPRQAAFRALKLVHQQGAFADIALDRVLRATDLTERDRRLTTELLYGSVRRQRTLDALIDQLGKKKAHQQPPDLRLILHLGFYQLRYLSQIPAPAGVDTTVTLAKQNGFQRLAGVVNGILRQYIRLTDSSAVDPLHQPTEPSERLGVLHSYPDWIVQAWQDQLQDWRETEALCQQLNQPPAIDLRINPLRTTRAEVEAAFQAKEIRVRPIPHLPQALRLESAPGAIQSLPGFEQGWWSVQDSSAQLVSHLLDPQPGETIIDACAAPGGKTTHIAELMADQGTIWACDRYASRLKKVQQNRDRLQLQSIQTWAGDSREFAETQADRVLIDAPCSGLGTLHRHADARWRQTPETVAELSQLQQELLNQAATWVKPSGYLVYATCTLHPQENEAVVQQFLQTHPQWQIVPPAFDLPRNIAVQPDGWLKVWPQQQQMDGFFMTRFQCPGA